MTVLRYEYTALSGSNERNNEKETVTFIVGNDSNMYTHYEHLLFTYRLMFARVQTFFTNTGKLNKNALSSTIRYTLAAGAL